MQAVYAAAQRKSERLGESVEGFTVEAGKLGQRLVAAETQYIEGLAKVKATNRQLQSLSKEILSSEKSAQSKSSRMHASCSFLQKHSCPQPILSLLTA